MVRALAAAPRRPRLRTELSEADARCLAQAVCLFGLPKAEIIRRLIRACVQVGPALSAGNTQTIIELTAQVRMATRYLSQVLKAVHAGRAIGIEDTEAVWHELHGAVAAINDELTEMTLAYGSKLRRVAGLSPLEGPVSQWETTG